MKLKMALKKKPKIKELRRKGIYIIPNLFTTGNIFCGVFSAISSMKGDFEVAAMAIVIAAIFDSLDGKLARLTHTTSRFGVEYDSLSDLVSFGVAPGLLVYAWALNSQGRLGWVAVFLFVACGALRLARFNLQVAGPESKDFVGLPIPAAAGFIATLVILDESDLFVRQEIRPALVMSMTYILAFLMVSAIRYRSFKEFNLKDRKPFSLLVSLVLLFFVFVNIPQVILFVLFSIYCLSGLFEKPLVWIYRVMRGVPREEAPSEPVPGDLSEDIEDKEILLKHK